MHLMPIGDDGWRTRRSQSIQVFAANHAVHRATPPEQAHDTSEQQRQQAVPDLSTPTEVPHGLSGASASPGFVGPAARRIASVRGLHAGCGVDRPIWRFRRFVTLVFHRLAGNRLVVENVAPGEFNSIVPSQGWHVDRLLLKLARTRSQRGQNEPYDTP